MIFIGFSFAFRIPWLTIAEKIGFGIELIYTKLTNLVGSKSNLEQKNSHEEVLFDDVEVQEISLNNDDVAQSYDELDEPILIDEDVDAVEYIENEVVNKTAINDNKSNKSFLAKNIFKSNIVKSSINKHQDKQLDNEIIPDLDKAEDVEVNKNNVSSNVLDFNDFYQKTVLPDISDLPPTNTFKHNNDDILDLNSSEIELVEKPELDGNIVNKSTICSQKLQNNTQGLLPDTNLLNEPKIQAQGVSEETIEFVSEQIHNTLAEFGIDVSISNVESGPVITRYELVPPKGVRGDKITSYAKDIARSLALTNIRILENIPGKSSMGIEVPNTKRQVIYLKEIFDSEVYQNNSSLLTLALGKDIAGQTIVTDLAKMPHLLVAGTTGSGKSVAVNAMILSILFNATPDEVKFIMIDPKMVELSFYQDIPHLLAPVVTDMSQAANALKWTVGEMEQRYKIMAKIGTKNIVGFNQKIETAKNAGEVIYNPYSLDQNDPEVLDKWPYIVVIIDELADLMMVAGKKIEQYIARIAQKARAVGIHLIVATQRPSVDVITGLIKANIPARISFQVSSKIDSRTILDQMGAETLLGQGDMLFLNPGSGFPRRIHGAFVNDDELNKVVDFLKSQGAPNYKDEILTGASDVSIPGFDDDSNSEESSIEKDTIFDQSVKFIQDTKRCSISSLQTQFGIGYNKAARIMNHLEKIGMVKRNERNGFDLLNH